MEPSHPDLSSRERLLVAARDLADELPLSRLYAGIPSAAVAERAGVTTGSFFHHFANATEFADAVVRSFEQPPDVPSAAVVEILDALDDDELAPVLKAGLDGVWQAVSTDVEAQATFRGQMHLFAHHGTALAHPDAGDADVGDVLRRTFRSREDAAAEGWRAVLSRSGLELIPPFTPERIATTLIALVHGLQIRHAVDPDAVDDELYSDVSTILTAAIAQPSGGPRALADVAALLAGDADLSPQARAGVRRRRESRRRITDAATGMFSRGWESVAAREVAEIADVSTQTVINLFRSVRAVAASTFGRHCADVQAAVDDLAEADPLGAILAGLRQVALHASADPEPARALVSERLNAVLHGEYASEDFDIRLQVPLGLMMTPTLVRLDLEGVDPVDLMATLVNFVLMRSIGRPGATDETVDLAARLLPAAARAGRPNPHPDVDADAVRMVAERPIP